MPALVTPDQDQYLRDHLWGVLVTTRAAGTPQATMVAYAWDGHDLAISCHRSSAKFVNASRRPAVAVTVADDRRYLAVYGQAEALATGPDRDALTARVQHALGPQDAAILERAFAQGLDTAGRVILRVVPEQVLGRI